METVTLKIQDHAVQRVMYLLKNLPKSDVEVVLTNQASAIQLNNQSNKQSIKQSMAGCLAQYAKPELIEKEKQLLDEALTDTLKEKYCVD